MIYSCGSKQVDSVRFLIGDASLSVWLPYPDEVQCKCLTVGTFRLVIPELGYSINKGPATISKSAKDYAQQRFAIDHCISQSRNLRAIRT